ncbi:MAG: glycosyltransferase [Candidatus Levyibacteriota bacterium]
MNGSSSRKTQSDNKPLISVVIPAYNEELYLPGCLEALKKQTYPHNKFEIILVDNNSTDKTAAIAKAAGATVIIEKIQGHVFALSTGMQKAKGDIIATTDADTKVNKDWLTIIERVFQDEEVAAVTGPAWYNSQSKMKRYLVKYSYYVYLKLHFAVGKPSLSGLNLAVRKKAFYKIKGLDTRYKIFSDVELGLRIKTVGKVLFCKELSVISSPRRWEKGTIEDYYKYVNSYFKTVWLLKPPKGDLTPHR